MESLIVAIALLCQNGAEKDVKSQTQCQSWYVSCVEKETAKSSHGSTPLMICVKERNK